MARGLLSKSFAKKNFTEILKNLGTQVPIENVQKPSYEKSIQNFEKNLNSKFLQSLVQNL